MNICGIIAEYNPFHEGHRYHIEKSREMTNAGLMISVMSGSFTQRGIPAFFDKFSRAEAAVKNGIDIVCEMPPAASLSSAEFFALSGVKALNSLGADVISFGSESGNISELTELAGFLSNEDETFSELVKKGLAEGLSYPAALQKALDSKGHPLSRLLDSPNNTLGLEYLKAIRFLELDMKAVTVKRAGQAYHAGEEFFDAGRDTSDASFPSSSSLRSMLKASGSEKYLENDDFTGVLSGRLHSLAAPSSMQSRYDFSVFADISADLSDKINNEIKKPFTFTDLAMRLKTKNMTFARICRCLWHIILDIKKEDVLNIRQSRTCDYLRILAFSEKGGRYLKEYRLRTEEDPSLPKLVQRPARDLSGLSSTAHMAFFKDITASNLYRQVYYEKYKQYIPDDYSYTIKPGTV